MESDRFYDLKGDGRRFEIKLIALAKRFHIRSLDPSFALEVRLRRSETTFGGFKESDTSFSLGLGVFLFND